MIVVAHAASEATSCLARLCTGTLGFHRHNQHLVHAMPIHVENLEDVALFLKGFPLPGQVAEMFDYKTGEGLVVLAIGVFDLEAGQSFLDALDFNHRVNQ